MDSQFDRAGEGAAPIAIVGIGCRFPGGVSDPAGLWALLERAEDAISEVPASRFDIDAHYDPRPGIPGKLVTRWGGFLPDIDRFDAAFFGISPREAIAMDPQQRLLLEVAWEAIDDSGQRLERLRAQRTGVFVGMINSDYRDLEYRDRKRLDIHVGVGTTRSVMSGRLSYALGFMGPSLVVDTACSSSLVALHLACASVRAGECEQALVGGVNLVLQPDESVPFSRSGMLSPEGRCKFGDARSDGFVRSDGVGVVVLKPLAQAVCEGDRVYAVVRGSAVNNDGDSSLLMTPSRSGQAAVLRQAYAAAGVPPSAVQYVEAHGTGTPVGDPIELGALGDVVGADREPDAPCLCGSLKTNIGHCEGAAGIAGLIKASLCLSERRIPASLHADALNPAVAWDNLGVAIPRAMTPWPDTGGAPARAGVNSFGLGGTNAHVVLEEAPSGYGVTLRSAGRAGTGGEVTRVRVLPVSARSSAALAASMSRYSVLLRGQDGRGRPDIDDVCFTAARRREHHPYREAVVGRTVDELAAALEERLTDPGASAAPARPPGERAMVWVFPGQGAQWLGMGRCLARALPAFRAALDELDEALREHVRWSLREQLEADESSSRMGEIDVVQPIIFSMQVALAAAWRAWGFEPDAVVGTSMGEVAAAHVAGALSLHDALAVICRRSALMRRVSGGGAMLSVEMDLSGAAEAIARYGDRVSIAASNSPSATVLSGEVAALHEIAARLREQDVFHRMIQVDVASHSAFVDPLRADLLSALSGLDPRRPSVPLYSTVAEGPCEAPMDAAYWVDNLRKPVLFDGTVAALLASGHDTFLEVSPHPILLPAIRQRLQRTGHAAALVPSLRRDQDEELVMLEGVASLYAAGVPVDFARVQPTGGRAIALPSYPWQRDRFWVDEDADASGPRGGSEYRHIRPATDEGRDFWEADLGPASRPYLGDHVVQNWVVWPASAYIEFVREAGEGIAGEGPCVLEDLSFIHPLVFSGGADQRIQVVLEAGADARPFRVYTTNPSADALLHARGSMRVGGDREASTLDLAALRQRCPRALSAADHYRAMEGRELSYGPGFRVVDELFTGTGVALGRLRLPASVDVGSGQEVLLDGCFQIFAQAFFSLGEAEAGIVTQATYVPVSVARMVLHAPIGDGAWCFARVGEGRSEALRGDLTIADADGRVLAEVQGFRIQRHERGLAGGELERLYARPRWQRAEALTAAPAAPGRWLLLGDRAGLAGGLGQALSRLGARCVTVAAGDGYAQRGDDDFTVDPNARGDLERLLARCDELPGGPGWRGIVHLWAAEQGDPDNVSEISLERATQAGCVGLLHLLQARQRVGDASAARLWLVTRASQEVTAGADRVDPGQALLWGMGRTVAYEYPTLRCGRVDLPAAPDGDDLAALAHELLADGGEDELAIRAATRFLARLERYTVAEAERETRAGQVSKDEPISGYRLEMTTPGVLDELVFREHEPAPPGPGQVQIRTRAAAMNFRDVMKALGLIPSQRGDRPLFGDECVGTVTAVGAGVDHVAPGDDVVAVHFERAFASHVNADAALVVAKPAGLSDEQAAGIPIVFLTAWCALRDLARVEAGDRVLVHAAAGGVGLAAVQLCQALGAEVFATAGSPEKRAYLRARGVAHVMDSRSSAFAEDIRAATGGRGVDVVLNSLAGELLHNSLEVLAPCGRFVEIGKRDLYANTRLGMGGLRDNISFLVLDIDQLYRLRPERVAAALEAVMDEIGSGRLTPLPTQRFEVAAAADAFRFMARGQHIGKIALDFGQPPSEVEAAAREPIRLRDDATYLVTGGLGALGLATASWLVERGVRHLALVGRRAPDEDAARAIATMTAAGAAVRTYAADVARADDVARLFDEVARDMAPLAGIIHSAGVLDDGVLDEQTAERFAKVLAPKLRGTWNLHLASEALPLDLFVLYSSAAAVVGPPGQGNYVAANAFLDAFAHYRAQRGLPCTSINWGPWADIGGLGSRPDYVERLAARGLAPHRASAGFAAFAEWLPLGVTQIAIMELDAARWCESFPGAGAGGVPRFEALVRRDGPAPSASPRRATLDRDTLVAASSERRRALLSEYIAAQAARVLRASAGQLDPARPLKSLGLDSLMAVELKNHIELELGVSVSIAKLLLEGASIEGLSRGLLDKLPAAPEPAGDTAGQAEPSEATADWEEFEV